MSAEDRTALAAYLRAQAHDAELAAHFAAEYGDAPRTREKMAENARLIGWAHMIEALSTDRALDAIDAH